MREMTISDILKMLLAHIKLIIIISVVAALGAYIYADNFIPKTYSASTKICIKTNSESQNSDYDDSGKINSGSITSSTSLADNSIIILTYAEEMLDVIKPGYSHSIASVNESNVLNITVTGGDPVVCAEVANAMRYKAPDVLSNYYTDAEAIPIGREASPPGAHSAPNQTRFALIGFIGGLIVSILIAIIIEIVDTTIKSGDDLYKMYDVPVFGEIIDFDTEGGAKKK